MSLNTDLVKATKDGDLEKVSELINSGADLNTTVGDSDKRSLLHHASQKGHSNLIEFLIERGIKVNSLDNRGRTPLYLACYDYKFDSAKTLVSNGAEINITGEYNPLDMASSNSYYGTEIVELLLENNANVNLTCRGTSVTPLMGALHQEKTDALQLLLNAGANTNHIDANGESPLGRISVFEFPERISLLLDFKAKINFQDRKGNSALHLATERENKKVIEVLIKRGIKTNLRNTSGETAKDVAKKKNSKIFSFISDLIDQNPKEENRNGILSKLGKLWK
jgi:ankyrin repeat protein